MVDAVATVVQTIDLTSNSPLPGDDHIRFTQSMGAHPLLVEIVDAAYKPAPEGLLELQILRAQVPDDEVVIPRLDLVAEAFRSFNQMILRNKDELDERKHRRLQIRSILGEVVIPVIGKSTLALPLYADSHLAAYFAIRAWVNAFIQTDMEAVLVNLREPWRRPYCR